MLHLFRYSILTTIRERTIMFWSLLFPIILGFFFNIGFSGANEFEIMDIIPTGIVSEESAEASESFSSFLKEMDGETIELFAYDSEAEAKEALEQKNISGYYVSGPTLSLIVNGTGLNESILTTLLNTYLQNEAIFMDIAQNHPENLQSAIADIEDYSSYTEEITLGGQTLDNFIIYFLALISMACLYGCFLGFQKAMELQPYNSPLGARRSAAPTHKLKLILTDWLAIVFLHYVNLLILLFVIRFIFQLNLGTNWGMILLVTLIGDIIGVSMGFLIGSVGKAKEGMKIGIMIGITMLFSFAAGLMFGNMKNMIEQHVPILNRINPAAMISDAFYCISVYDDPDRLARNLTILGIMSAALVLISFFVTKKERYDSI